MNYFSNFNKILFRLNIFLTISLLYFSFKNDEHPFIFLMCIIIIGGTDLFLRYMYKSSVDANNYQIFAGIKGDEDKSVVKKYLHKMVTLHSFTFTIYLLLKLIKELFNLEFNFIAVGLLLYCAIFLITAIVNNKNLKKELAKSFKAE